MGEASLRLIVIRELRLVFWAVCMFHCFVFWRGKYFPLDGRETRFFSVFFVGSFRKSGKYVAGTFLSGCPETDTPVVERAYFSGKTHGLSARTFQWARFRLLRGLVHMVT